MRYVWACECGRLRVRESVVCLAGGSADSVLVRPMRVVTSEPNARKCKGMREGGSQNSECATAASVSSTWAYRLRA